MFDVIQISRPLSRLPENFSKGPKRELAHPRWKEIRREFSLQKRRGIVSGAQRRNKYARCRASWFVENRFVYKNHAAGLRATKYTFMHMHEAPRFPGPVHVFTRPRSMVIAADETDHRGNVTESYEEEIPVSPRDIPSEKHATFSKRL